MEMIIMDKLRKDIVRSIRGQFPDVTLKEIDQIIVAFLNQVKEEVNNDNTVNLYGFAKFSPKSVTRETHFNGIANQYEERKVEYNQVSFKSSKIWKQQLNKKEDDNE